MTTLGQAALDSALHLNLAAPIDASRSDSLLALLDRASRDLAGSSGIFRMPEVLRAARQALNVEAAAIWLWDPGEPGVLVCRASDGVEAACPPAGARVPAAASVASWAAHEGELFLIPNVQADPRFSTAPYHQEGACLAVPLIAGGDTLGVIECMNRLDGAFDRHDQAAVQVLAALLAAAVDAAQAAQELSRQAQVLQTHRWDLDTLSSVLDYCLKRPLRQMVDLIESAGADRGAPAQPDYGTLSQALLQDVHRMGHAVNRIRLLSQFHQATASREQMDMDALLAEALRRLDHAIRAHQAQVVVHPLPQAIGRHEWVAEVWVHLIDNAIQHGGRPPRIEVGGEAQDGRALFWVRDNGPGIAPSAQSRLFMPLAEFRRTRIDRRGLGLALVREVVEKLGGQVGAGSHGEGGVGTTFYFSLPGCPGGG